MTTLTPVKTSEAAKTLVLRRVAKHHERIALLYKLKVRVAQLEAFIIKTGNAVPPECA